MNRADEVFELFEIQGHELYFGERVSILEHSLQAAWLARQAGAQGYLVVAALLHDIGHVLHGQPEEIAAQGIDGMHEKIGEAWLRSRFGPEITEPARFHVDAKRYLCYSDPEYLRQLSPSSVQSLELQGGAFTEGDAREFERNPYFRDAVAVRRWDDAAKTPELVVPNLRGYRELLESAR